MNSGWPAGIASGDYIGKGKEIGWLNRESDLLAVDILLPSCCSVGWEKFRPCRSVANVDTGNAEAIILKNNGQKEAIGVGGGRGRRRPKETNVDWRTFWCLIEFIF